MAPPRAWGLTEDNRNINRAKRDSKSWAKGYRQPSTIGCGRWLPILAQFCIHAIWQERVSIVKEDQEYCRYNSLQLWGLAVWLLLLITAPKVWWLDSTSDLLDNSAEHRQVLNAAPWKGFCMTVLDVVLALECCADGVGFASVNFHTYVWYQRKGILAIILPIILWFLLQYDLVVPKVRFAKGRSGMK